MKTRRMKADRDDSEDEPRAAGTRGKSRKKVPDHMFHDIGPAIAEADYRPRIYGNPEEIMAAAFLAMGRRTYAAVPPLGADAPKALDELRTVLQGAD